MTTINALNTMRDPNRSINVPTTMRAGMVKATLAMSRILMCSSVNQSVVLRIVVPSGARLNHT